VTNEEGHPALIVLDAGRLERACEELGIDEDHLARLVRRYLGHGRLQTLDDLVRWVGDMAYFARVAGLEPEDPRG
jgi:hypothetical protein